MFCIPLLEITELDANEKQKLDDYLKEVLPNGYLSVSQAVQKTGIKEKNLLAVLTTLIEKDYLDLVYAIRCPECGHLIKKIDNVNDFSYKQIDYCYACDQDIQVSSKDIVVLFKLKNRSFNVGQSDFFTQTSPIAHEIDTLESLRKISKTFELLYNMQYGEIEKREQKNIQEVAIHRKAYAKYDKNKKKYTVIWVSFNIIVFFVLCYVLFVSDQNSKITPFITIVLFASDRILDFILRKIFVMDYDELVRQYEFNLEEIQTG